MPPIAAGSVSSTDRFDALCEQPLFSVEGSTYRWADVLASASAHGSLERFRRRSRWALECVRRSEMRGGILDPEALREEGRRFRYDRRLISSEELAAWLERWRLTVDEWSAYLKRSLLLERCAGELDAAEPVVPGELAPYEDAAFVDAVCSGYLEREAFRFASDAALARLDGERASGERGTLIERIAAAAESARAAATSGRGVEREIAARRLDWTRIELAVLEVRDRDVALEAALCVRVDRRPLAEVALACGGPPKAVSLYLEDVEPWLSPALVSAQPGELVGPVEHAGSWLLAAVNGRSGPSGSDPELQRRAKAVLVERVNEQAMRARVKWHEHL